MIKNNGVLISLWLLVAIVDLSGTTSLTRRKRSLVQLEEVMQCATQLPGGAFRVFETYNCYGCFCGKGGVGEPVDEIDRCCQAHDHCYDQLTDSKTCSFWLGQVYIDPYSFECTNGSIALPTPSGNTTEFTPLCSQSDKGCARGACDCDVAFANCIRQYSLGPKQYCPQKRLVCIGEQPWHWFGRN